MGQFTDISYTITMKIHSWVIFAAFSIIFWLIPVDAKKDVKNKFEKPSKFWSDWKIISELNPGLHTKLERRGRQYDMGEFAANTTEGPPESNNEVETNITGFNISENGLGQNQPMGGSLKMNQLYAAAFLVENYLKLIPDEAMLESIICKQIQSKQAPRGILDMLDFYSIIGTFWDKHGSKFGDLDWVRMYDTYSDDVEFEKMFKKKENYVKIIWSGKELPSRKQMKSIITHLNKHPEKTKEISAAVQILREFTSSARISKMTQPAMPRIRSALLIAKTAMEESESACKVVEDDTEHKDKTFEDTELLLSIGKAIACVLCGVLTPGLCDVACKISL